jgi:TRAP-type transport system small permease protein
MDTISRVLRAAIGGLLVALVVIVALGVVYRYFLQSSLSWGTEVPSLLLVWLVFLGSVVAYHERSHIAFTIVTDALPPALGRWSEVLVLLVTLVFFAIMAWLGLQLTQQTTTSLTPALRISQAWIYGAVPVASGLIVLMSLPRLIAAIRAATATPSAEGR